MQFNDRLTQVARAGREESSLSEIKYPFEVVKEMSVKGAVAGAIRLAVEARERAGVADGLFTVYFDEKTGKGVLVDVVKLPEPAKSTEPQPITPTVGRIVWYTPPFDENDQDNPALPGIVAAAHNDRCVNLGLFGYDGKPVQAPPTSVTLVQPGDEYPEGGNYCEWMPYQLQQASKITLNK